jgi:hypothetical protein
MPGRSSAHARPAEERGWLGRAIASAPAQAVPVTADTFVRAETDLPSAAAIKRYVKKAIGRIDQQVTDT